MPLPTFYAVGAASVANGDTAITFTGALLGTADAPNIQAGDLFFDPAQPLVPGQRIASVDYEHDTAELWADWPGTSLTDDPYEVRYTGDPIRSTAQTRRYLEMLGQLSALGIQPDYFGDFAGRDAYDDAARGVIYLSLDGDAGATTTAWTLYTKLSSDDADWSAGQTMEGAQGPQGDTGLIGVWRGAYSGATAYAEGDVVRDNGSSWIALQATTGHAPPTLPTTSNDYWELTTQKGDKGDPGNDGADGTNGADGADGIMSSVVAGTGLAVDATDPANPVVGLSPTTQNTINSKITIGDAIITAMIFGF